ncbi:MAG: OmpA family protein [Nitrospiria bacterium]
MKQSILFLLFVGFGLVFSLEGCSKKVAPISGTAGLSEEGVIRPSGGMREERVKEERLLREGMAMEPGSGEDRMQRGGLAQGEESMQGLAGERFSAIEPAAVKGSEALTDIFFDFNKASLKEGSKLVLQRNAEILMLHSSATLQIQGHTDERGSDEYNLVLGERRAKIVRLFLEALGVDQGRIETISYGEERPFCAQSEERCWQQNRRAHFLVQLQK